MLEWRHVGWWIRSVKKRRRLTGGPVPKSVVIGAVALILIVVAFFGVKRYADDLATTQTDERVAELEELLGDSTPEDFLAFNAGSQTAGSVAQAMADQGDFVSVIAGADRAVARFQPEGWWQGFTERCVVAVITADGVELEIPKVPCIQIDPVQYGS